MKKPALHSDGRNDVQSLTAIPLVILFGGGIESTSLVKHFLRKGKTVLPVHEHWGLRWEDCELRYARRFCQANACDRLHPLIEIRHSPDDVLNQHWSITGVKIPQAGDPPPSLEIPVRNLTLLTVAAAHLPQLPELHLVMGTTADNHFSDGSRAFFDACEERLTREFHRPIRVLTPLIHADKTRVIREADPDALFLSFSCLSPRGDLHCGACYKCGRRKAAFQNAGVHDPTVYAELS
jgi:7-cyano-7-deazaguanine synthase